MQSRLQYKAGLHTQIYESNNKTIPAILEERLNSTGSVTEDRYKNNIILRVNLIGFEPFEAVEDWSVECKILEEMIANRKLVRDKISKDIEILRVWILLTKKVISGEKKEKIESLVNELHNPNLTKEYQVTRIRNDGEIDFQKGGKIYGMRSVFTEKVSLNVEGLCFTIKKNSEFSHAIVTSQDAEKIRKMIGNHCNIFVRIYRLHLRSIFRIPFQDSWIFQLTTQKN